MNFNLSVFIIVFLFLPKVILANEVLNPIVVQKEGPYEEFATQKVETVSKEKFKQPTRTTLSDLVKDQVGVESQEYCSNCGAKRLTINGLKAEHTSILVDGLPIYSAVSSFYGVDAIPVNGIETVEVMRGTGASLTNPEAIGGTLNIVTKDPLELKGQQISTSFTVDNEINKSQENHSFMLSLPNSKKNFSMIFGGQHSKQQSWDEDSNNIAESPERENISLMSKAKWLVNDKNELTFRGAFSDVNIIGGAHNGKKPTEVRATPASPSDFSETGNVESTYIGDPFRITDWVSLRRYELQSIWKRHLSNGATFNLNTGAIRQEQRSIYQHGFDYANNDHLFVADSYFQFIKGSHLLKVGAFAKDQRLRSSSTKLFTPQPLGKGLPKDSFNHRSLALYLQDTYLVSEDLEFDFALRGDYLTIRWQELEEEVDEFVLAPRFQLKHNLTHHLTQRFSYGLGYRSPLTYFESQHGNNELGYKLDITKLEKSHSLVYSLSQNTPKYYTTLSTHYTHLQNMAYGFSQAGTEVSYQNTNEAYDIWALDLLLGYQINENFLVELSFEEFLYEDGYTKKLPTAAIERRVQLQSTYSNNRFSFYTNLRWVGSRDLSRYGEYDQHFVNYQSFPPLVSNQKNLKAPDFFVLDLSASYMLNKTFTLSAGVNNALDFTQAGEGDNPSAWHWHFTHAHYDGLHTWGPNRGREWFLQLSAKI